MGDIRYPNPVLQNYREFPTQSVGGMGRCHANFKAWMLITTHRTQLGFSH